MRYVFVFLGILFLTLTPCYAVDLKYAGSVTILEGIMKDAAPAFEHKTGLKIGLSGGGSRAGVNAVLQGLVADIAPVGSQIS